MFEADPASQESGGIREALDSLDAATREFTHRLEELGALGVTPARTNGANPQPEPEPVPEPELAPAAPPTPFGGSTLGGLRLGGAEAALDRRMADAEAEAEQYLEQAKRRADALVQSIVCAVEQEAEAMRRDAETQIRTRWTQVEADAERFLDEARRAADGLVEERRRRISQLSDTIVGLAETLTKRMADAALVRRQFDSLVVALSDAAGRLASDPGIEPPVAAAPAPEAAPAAQSGPAPAMWRRDRTGAQPAAPRRAA